MTSFNLEKEYEIVFNNTQDALFIIKVTEKDNFEFLKLNPTHENLTGLKTEKIKGKTPEEILGKKEGRKVSNKYRKCLEKEETVSYEEVLSLPSGKKYWSTKLSPVIEDGEVTHIVGSSRNITERKKLQKEKDEINKRYKLATNVGGIGVWKLFLENNKLIWDREMKKIYGFSTEKNDIEYEDWVNSIHPEDRERVNKDFNKAVENKTKFNNEFRINTNSGEAKYIRAFGQIVTNENDKPIQVIGVNYDITERKLYEKRYKTLFDESLFGVALLDPKTAKPIEFNETLCDMLGYSREEFAKLSISDYEAKENEEEIKQRVERMLNGSKEKFETKHRKKDGTIIDVLIKASAVILNGEKYIHVMYMDITKRKKALEKLEEYSNEMEIKNMELEQAKIKAQEASKAKSEFLANMSHEIRTPMNSIIGMADLLLETDLSNTQREYIEILSNAGENLLNIINDILDLSKIEVNDKWAEMLGYEKEELKGKIETWQNLLHEDDKEEVFSKLDDHFKGGKDIYEVEARLKTKDNKYKWIKNIGKVVERDKDSKPKRAVGIHLDIDDSKRMERKLQEQKAYFEQLFAESTEGIILLDNDGNVLKVSEHFEKLFGYKEEEILGEDIDDLIVPAQIMDKGQGYTKKVANGGDVKTEGIRQKKNGEKIHVSLHAFPITLKEGQLGIYTIYNDISQRKKEEEKIRYLSFHDQMTGLYNRRYFENEMERLSNSRMKPVSIIVADIDDLKVVNDNHGHKKGDEYIKSAAEIIESAVRKEDIAARIGGDEFAVILPYTEKETAEKIITRINNICEEKKSDLRNDLNISVGCATCQNEEDLDEIFVKADKIMYSKKKEKV